MAVLVALERLVETAWPSSYPVSLQEISEESAPQERAYGHPEAMASGCHHTQGPSLPCWELGYVPQDLVLGTMLASVPEEAHLETPEVLEEVQETLAAAVDPASIDP